MLVLVANKVYIVLKTIYAFYLDAIEGLEQYLSYIWMNQEQ